jgi:hypothetical protein
MWGDERAGPFWHTSACMNVHPIYWWFRPGQGVRQGELSPCMEACMSPGSGEVSTPAGSTALQATSIVHARLFGARQPHKTDSLPCLVDPPRASCIWHSSASAWDPSARERPWAPRPAQHGSAVECVLSSAWTTAYGGSMRHTGSVCMTNRLITITNSHPPRTLRLLSDQCSLPGVHPRLGD